MEPMEPMRVGIVGCGNISGIYCKNLQAYAGTTVVACADLEIERAKQKAAEYGIPKALTTEALLADPEVELVLNLTIPASHGPVALAAAKAGKHVYNEKPFSIRRDQGQELLAAAKAAGVRTGGAPDTFLGGGHQTCRKIIDDGHIGEPVAAHAFMLCHGHENWHPNPEFLYKPGGGPMFDMGPYYLTALVNMVGGIRSVLGSTRITFPTRHISSQPLAGGLIQVEVPTHIAGILEFDSGAIGEITTSFDVWHSSLPAISVYGSEGTLIVPDPNGFGGKPLLRRKGDSDWQEVPLTHARADNARGVGVLDMVYAIREGRPHRASGDLAFHVLDTMIAIHESSDRGRRVVLGSKASRPAAMPAGLQESEPIPGGSG